MSGFINSATWHRARAVMLPVAAVSLLSCGIGLLADIGLLSRTVPLVGLAASVEPFLIGMMAGSVGVCVAVERGSSPRA